MKNIVYTLLLLLFITPLGAQAKISDLLDGDPKYPLYVTDKDEDLFIFTRPQVDMMITYLEDRINLKRVIKETEEKLKFSDLNGKKYAEIVQKDSEIISSLTSTVKLNEEQTIVKLASMDYTIKKVDLFLTEERDELIKKNSRLKGVLWTVVPIATAAIILLTVTK